MTSKFRLVLLGVGFAFAFGSAAHADPAQQIDQPALVAQVVPEVPESLFGGTGPVDESALQSVSGMASLQQYANANNTSVVAGNSVDGQSVTGEIAIDGHAFHNLNGLSILTANTGNNVSINAAMNVNVSIQQ